MSTPQASSAKTLAEATVLLPLALIASITVWWRMGANPVLSFWLAYILTRPLGANIGPPVPVKPCRPVRRQPSPSQTKAAIAKYQTLARQAIAQDKSGNSTSSHATVQKMRDGWDADSTSLQAVNKKTWTLLDGQMDAVLKAYAIDHGKIQPASSAEQQKQLSVLLTDLSQHHF